MDAAWPQSLLFFKFFSGPVFSTMIFGVRVVVLVVAVFVLSFQRPGLTAGKATLLLLLLPTFMFFFPLLCFSSHF